MKWIICVSNLGFEASLETRKLYNQLPDAAAETRGMVRVIDESGEDYLFSATMFSPIAISQPLERILLAA
jgi:hypothetical protein